MALFCAGSQGVTEALRGVAGSAPRNRAERARWTKSMTGSIPDLVSGVGCRRSRARTVVGGGVRAPEDEGDLCREQLVPYAERGDELA